jgi:uncharacterized membrane protein YfcA
LNTFYESLSLPVYLLLTIGGSLAFAVYFLRKTNEYPKIFILGTIFVALSAFTAGIVRILREFDIAEKYSNYFGATPIPFVLGSFVFIFIGAYQKVKYDERKKRQVILLSIALAVIVLFVVCLSVFILLKK